MADRNPSKQRRQAQNRAVREARKARSEAANLPVEERRTTASEEPVDRRSRRRRTRKSREDVRAEARSVIEAEEAAAEIYDDDEFEDEFDDDSETGEDPETPPAVTVAPGARRGSSPVFSARHRTAVAASTAGSAPARTHVGVAAATGTEVVAERTRTPSRVANRGSSTTERATATAKVKASSGSGGSASARSRSNAAATRPRSAPSRPAPRQSDRRPAKPLPSFFDRFGGNEPGGRWVLLSFATVVLASIVLNFVHIIPEVVENAKGKKVQTGEYFTIWHFGLGPGLLFLLPPLVILGLFIVTAKPWDRRRSWNFALALMALSTFMTQSISIYIIPIGCLAWGCWQARKAALADVGGDPQVLREVERERRIAARDARRARRSPD